MYVCTYILVVIEVNEAVRLSEEGDGWRYTIVILEDGKTFMKCSFIRSKMHELFRRLEKVGVR